MITFQMVMSRVLFEYIVNRPLAEENHPVQTFGFDRQDEAFGIGIQIRRTRRQLHRFYVHRSE